MSKLLTLTLVIPVYNEEDHLKDCLDAIAKQSQKPMEVIVVDNNSTDGSMSIAKQYPFVRILKEKQQGIAHARDKGFNAVKSDIIARIDGDTILPKNWIKRVLNFYKNPEHQNQALTGGGYFYNLRMPKLNGWILSQFSYRVNRFIVGFYILWGSNMAMPVDLWKAVRSNVCHQRTIHEDLDLAIHLHRRGYQVVYNANMRVGVYMKRVWENRDQLNEHLGRWPQTLKSHGYKLWWLSLWGNFGLKYIVQPYGYIVEMLSRFVGRPSLPHKRK